MGKSRNTDQEFHFPQENEIQAAEDAYREPDTDTQKEFADHYEISRLDEEQQAEGRQDENWQSGQKKRDRRVRARLAMTAAAAVTVVCVMESSMGYDLLGYDFLNYVDAGGYQDTEPSSESKTKKGKTTVTLQTDPYTVTVPWEEAVNPEGKYREYTYYYVVEITFEKGKYPSAVFDTFKDAMQDTDDMYGSICSWLDANGFDSGKLTKDEDASTTKFLGRETSEDFMIVGDGDNLGAAWVISGSVTDRYEIHEKYVLTEE